MGISFNKVYNFNVIVAIFWILHLKRRFFLVIKRLRPENLCEERLKRKTDRLNVFCHLKGPKELNLTWKVLKWQHEMWVSGWLGCLLFTPRARNLNHKSWAFPLRHFSCFCFPPPSAVHRPPPIYPDHSRFSLSVLCCRSLALASAAFCFSHFSLANGLRGAF